MLKKQTLSKNESLFFILNYRGGHSKIWNFFANENHFTGFYLNFKLKELVMWWLERKTIESRHRKRSKNWFNDFWEVFWRFLFEIYNNISLVEHFYWRPTVICICETQRDNRAPIKLSTQILSRRLFWIALKNFNTRHNQQLVLPQIFVKSRTGNLKFRQINLFQI